VIPGYFLPVLALGAVGATARYLLDAYIAARFPSTLPWGTFAVNMSGSLLLGLFTGMVVFGGAPTALKVILGTGFCGAYTTFSTFTFETVRLIEERSLYEAAANVLVSFFAGLLAAGAGLALGAWA
jgi:CrcB protein